MNQLQALLSKLLASTYGKYATGIIGTVATMYWLPPLLAKGHPLASQDIGMLVTGAIALTAWLQASAFTKVNQTAVDNAAAKAKKPTNPPPLPILCAVVVAVALPFVLSFCTAQQAKSADTVVVDLTNAICSPADPLDTNPIVAVVCEVAQVGEAVVPVVTTLKLKMPKEQVPGFVAAHSHATSNASITVTVTEAGKQ